MKIFKTFILSGLLAGTLTAPLLVPSAAAHDDDKKHGKSKHNFCYDKHGRWRSHPHCPAPRASHSHGHHHHGQTHYRRYPSHHDAWHRDAHRPQTIYVIKDRRYDRAPSKPAARDDYRIVREARKEVQESREQLRNDRAELRKDRAELRRDIRNRASKEEIRKDRQEIRADLQKIKTTRHELRNDRADLEMARRDWARK